MSLPRPTSIQDYLSAVREGNGFLKYVRLSGSVEYIPTSSTFTLTSSNSASTYTLSWGGQTTGAVAGSASAATLQTALTGLSSIGTGNATVSGAAPTYTVTVLPTAVVPISTLTGTGTGFVSVVTQTLAFPTPNSAVLANGFTEIERFYPCLAATANKNGYVSVLYDVTYNLGGVLNYTGSVTSGTNQLYLGIYKNGDTTTPFAKSKAIDIPASGTYITTFGYNQVDARNVYGRGLQFLKAGDYISLYVNANLTGGSGLTMVANNLVAKANVSIEGFGVAG